MARNVTSKGGNSRIRFIMIDADLSEGDLSEVTQAIQNALRPLQTPNTRLIQAPTAPRASASENGPEEEADFEDVGEETAPAAKPRASRSTKTRVAKTPSVLDDIDISTDPSLKDFVAQFDLSTTQDKYLVIALWFRDARSTPSVTADHIYTCFRLLSWSTATNDFSKPLRNLRDDQAFKGGAKDGFALSLTGAGKIEAKKRSQ